MNQAMDDITSAWKNRTGYELTKDMQWAIYTILNQVSEFKKYLSPTNPVYNANVEQFVVQMFGTYKTGRSRVINAHDSELIFTCGDYIHRNQKQLFGKMKHIPQPVLYYAIMTITVSLCGLPEKDLRNSTAGLFRYCGHGLHLYDEFLTKALDAMGTRLGEITQRQ